MPALSSSEGCCPGDIAMRSATLLLLYFIGAMLGTTANAQIYESKDAQGNTVFSDRPSSGAEVIEVPPTNSADPVVETPRPPPSPDAADAAATRPERDRRPASGQDLQTDDDYIYYGDDERDDVVEDRIRREQRRDRDDIDRPDSDRPQVDHRRDASRPAVRRGRR
jgi:hypothetical protein